MVVIVDMLNTISRSIIRISNNSEEKPIFSLIVMSFLCVLMLYILTICSIYSTIMILCKNQCRGSSCDVYYNSDSDTSDDEDIEEDSSSDDENKCTECISSINSVGNEWTRDLNDNECIECIKECTKVMSKVFIVILQSAAVCLYFVGDNLYYTVDRYGGCLPSCGSDCVKHNFYIAKACSGAAAISYAIVKFIQDLNLANKDKNKTKKYLSFIPMIAVIGQMDLLLYNRYK